MKKLTSLLLLLFSITNYAQDCLIFQEKNGIVSLEAEHFSTQDNDSVRAWYVFSKNNLPVIKPDPDPTHIIGASNEEYIEILPDTRVTKADKLHEGVNFSNIAGQIGVVSYFVDFETTGKYYVWARIYSNGTEDNGLHVGIDDTWPSSGNRMQWCTGKNSWKWESKQRTDTSHCGEPYLIYLNVESPGIHKISFSMREDGAEFDKWLMTIDKNFIPSSVGPEEILFEQE